MDSREPALDAVERRRLMDEGRDAFNRGEFYEAHESWEEVWDVLDEPDRLWVQGLIQIATGLHKLSRNRPDLCDRLVRRGLGKLDGAPPVLDGIDLTQLRSDTAELLDRLVRGERPPQTVAIRLRRAS